MIYAKIVCDDKFFVREVNISTSPINLSVEGDVGPTTLYCWYTYDRPDEYAAEISKFVWDNYEEEEAPYFEQSGLAPNSSYVVKVMAVLKNGTNVSATKTFKTLPLSLSILSPKIPKATKALALAATNVTYREESIGFQWKKYDAPSSLLPSEGRASVYEGTLQGVINNLQTDHYYNLRAYYKDRNDKYYYSDWITFDPSDFSWIDPIVHTFAAENITKTSAKLRGYILPGSSDVISQGFEYWIANLPNSVKRLIADNYSVEAEKQTVLSSGQMMIAELYDLQPGTDYVVRSFVDTNDGLFYGEETSFTTEGSAGIDDVENVEIIPIAYFDISGHKATTPFSGFNIVLMSDGSVRKVVLK